MNNPYVRAVLAALYIVVLVFAMNNVASITEGMDGSILMPMTMLSLFVFSAAVMGFLFLQIPLQLFLDGSRREAIAFFGKTVVTFGVFAALFAAALLYSALS